MKFKIVAYGDPLLRLTSEDIEPDYPGLHELIDNMFESMKESNGVGLAAPQIGLNIKLFVIDSTVLKNNKDGKRMAFINPEILEFTGKRYSYEEGCLSIPGIHEDVVREEKIRIWYQDENFNEYEEEFDGINARIIQHEYDHLFGKLFIDKISPLKKKLLKRKLNDIINGTVEVDYPMRFYTKSKVRV
jgi:peptide deformylase